MTKNATVWTKKGSQECLAALKALKSLGYTVEEKALKSKADIDAFKLAYPDAKTVPLIVVDETVVGGLASISSLPEALTARADKASKASARTPHATRAERWATKKAASAAKKEEKLTDRAARKEAWATNPNNIRMFKATTPEEKAQRAAIKAEKTAASKAKRRAAQPVREGAPGIRTLAAASLRTPEEAATYQAERKAARIAESAARREATVESRVARRATEKARVAAAIEARKAALA